MTNIQDNFNKPVICEVDSNIESMLLNTEKSLQCVEINIKDNLHKPIKDCEENSDNEMTYLEFFCYGYAFINCPLTDEDILKIMNESNEQLNERLEELDWLMDK